MARLLLAEHAHQVEDFVRRGVHDPDQWIALGPSAMASLDSMGLDYKIPEDFYQAGDLADFCDDTHKLVRRLCEFLDLRLPDHSPAIKSLGLPVFRFNIFALLVLFDGVRSRIFQLAKIFAAYPDYTIQIHKSETCESRATDLFFSNKDTLWGRVASLKGWQVSLELLSDLDPNERTTTRSVAPTARQKVKRLISKSPFLTSAARLSSQRNYHGLWNLFARTRATVLVINEPYEWAHILPRLSKEGLKILFVSEGHFSDGNNESGEELRPGFKLLESDPSFQRYFEFGGVDYYPLLKDRLAWIWHASPGLFEDVSRKVSELKERHNISALLRCSSAPGTDHAINESARRFGIPVLVWQHGAVSCYRKITQFRDYADLMTSDYTFVFGKDVAAAYGQTGREFPARVIAVGAPSLDAIANSKEYSAARPRQSGPAGGRKRLLYATSNYMQNHWYYGWPPPQSDRKFFQDQLCIVNYLRTASEQGLVDAIVKLHPAPEYLDPPWVSDLNTTDALRVVKGEESFDDLLKRSDVVVLDFPSTTLLKSLATASPVFVLTGHCLFNAEAQAMLGKRAVAVGKADELVSALRSFFADGSYPANVKDQSFLKGYGTHLNDGKSGARALEILSDILADPDRLSPEALPGQEKEYFA
jgi:hypothetical protein